MERRNNRHRKRNDWKRFLDIEGMPRPIWGDADRVVISAIQTLFFRGPKNLAHHLGVESSRRLIFSLKAGAQLAEALEAELPRDSETPTV